MPKTIDRSALLLASIKDAKKKQKAAEEKQKKIEEEAKQKEKKHVTNN